MIPYQFHVGASSEYLDAALFYESRLPGLGAAFVEEVQRSIGFVCERPAAGLQLGARVRKVVVSRFPFTIVYRHQTDHILILAVAHQRRRPGYWRGRT